MTNPQLDLWKSGFGDEYAERNARLENTESVRALFQVWSRVLQNTKHSKVNTALEVGCNIGANLYVLKNLVQQCSGVEPNEKVVAMAKANPELKNVNIQNSDGYKLPFADASQDLVFTSGVLIHVAPDDLGKMTDEIYRTSKRYIACLEYFSPQPTEIKYRGLDGFLFKRDFGGFYLDRYPDLKVVDYGFFWKRTDLVDDLNWWLFEKR